VTYLRLALFVVLPLSAGCANVWGFPDLSSSTGSDGGVADSSTESGGGVTDSSTGSDGGVTDGGGCTVFPQGGCGVGQTCTEVVLGTTQCITNVGAQQAGYVCSSAADCVPGLICVGNCRPTCSYPGACAGGGQCIQLSAANNSPIPNVGVCTISCDLSNPNACGGCAASGGCAGCILAQNGSTYFTDCSTEVGSVGQGGACNTTTLLCKAGYACNGTPGACSQWCKQPGGTCTTGTCAAGGEVVNGQSYSICE
jgi:hypothetical protein